MAYQNFKTIWTDGRRFLKLISPSLIKSFCDKQAKHSAWKLHVQIKSACCDKLCFSQSNFLKILYLWMWNTIKNNFLVLRCNGVCITLGMGNQTKRTCSSSQNSPAHKHETKLWKPSSWRRSSSNPSQNFALARIPRFIFQSHALTKLCISQKTMLAKFRVALPTSKPRWAYACIQ